MPAWSPRDLRRRNRQIATNLSGYGAAMLTVITRLTLKDGAEQEWDGTMRDRMRAAEDQDGWIGGQLLKPLDEPAVRVIVGTWESRSHWEDWHDEEAFRATRDRLEGLQTGPAEVAWHEAVLDRRGE
jgi:heme-degrading monooxygenase HmoA